MSKVLRAGLLLLQCEQQCEQDSQGRAVLERRSLLTAGLLLLVDAAAECTRLIECVRCLPMTAKLHSYMRPDFFAKGPTVARVYARTEVRYFFGTFSREPATQNKQLFHIFLT